MAGSHTPQQNHLLAALSGDERERIYPHLQLVAMPGNPCAMSISRLSASFRCCT
jgi:hypothetical protein